MNLKEYREFKNISVLQVSKELNISRQHIYDIEKSKSFPSRKLAVKINKWSGGFITQGELLFPDVTASVNDNLITIGDVIIDRSRSAESNMHYML